MKIESVSNKNYLKKYQIKSPLISSYSVLNSSILYEKYNDDYDFSSSVSVIEDLSKDDGDSFEFIIPNYNFSKETNLTTGNFFDSLKINSKGNYKKFNTNVDEADIVNDLILNSNNQSNLNNLSTDLSFLIRNINTYGNLSETYKENTDYKILSNVMYNLEYPLIKETNSSRSFLTPVGSFRYSPNKGLNLKDENKLITYQDLFILDRFKQKTVEAGASATFGLITKFKMILIKINLI